MKTDKGQEKDKPRSHHKVAGKSVSPPEKETRSEEPEANGNPIKELPDWDMMTKDEPPVQGIPKQFAEDAVEAASKVIDELIGGDVPIKNIEIPPVGARIGLIFKRTAANKTWDTIMAEIRASVYHACLNRGMDIEADDFKMFSIVMPCGCSVIYKRFRDLPLEDTPCACGQSWFVKYVDQLRCEVCKGSGKSNLYQGVIMGPCRACGGTGIE